MSGPTKGAEEAATWRASPALARAIRIAVFVLPLVVAWVAVRLLDPVFWRQPGGMGTAALLAQIVIVATAVAMVVDRQLTRLLPLATLLGVSLAFPDKAPSRFKVALRAGTTRQLQQRIDDAVRDGLNEDASIAAGQAIELVTLLGRHERLTRGHTERVRAYSDLLAGELGLDDAEREKLAWAALLHDIGKLTVPAEILNKQGRPTDDEWNVLRNHPAAGVAFVEPLADWLGEWRLATSEHHERWDGAGYPLGLEGTDISLAGRIVAVADAYDVITSKRSYKEPMSSEAARRELVACAGSQFDPAVVRAFLAASIGTERRTARLAWLTEAPRFALLAAGASKVPGVALAAVLSVAAATLGSTFDAVPDELAAVSDDPADDEITSTEADPQATDEGASPAGDESPFDSDRFTTSSIARTGSTEAADDPASTTSTTQAAASTTTSPAASSVVSSTVTTVPSTTSTSAATTSTTGGTTTSTTAATTSTSTSTSTSTTAQPQGPNAVRDFAAFIAFIPTSANVVSNDVAGDDPIDTGSLRIVTGPSNGGASVVGSAILYSANLGFTGVDTVVYEICDTAGRCDQATLTLTHEDLL